ncbi:MAG: hypothetical protein R3F54_19645 [Alphaproteobacteria bacterium]
MATSPSGAAPHLPDAQTWPQRAAEAGVWHPPADRQGGFVPSNHIVAGKPVIVAEADLPGSATTSRQAVLESILELDDIQGAKAFVDALADAKELDAATISAMNDRIWHFRAKRMADYSAEMREAITRSDVDRMRALSESMRRLTASAASRGRGQADAPAPATTADTKETAGFDPQKAPLTDRDDGFADRARRALDEGRLLPPGEDNAFDLAVNRLSGTPDDAAARGVLEDVIQRQENKVKAAIEAEQPVLAMDQANQLLDAAEGRPPDAALPKDRLLQLRRWMEEIEPIIAAGLIAKAEEAIDENELIVAPEGALSAQDYVDRLKSFLGPNHDDVVALADAVLTRYHAIGDGLLARREYGRALTIHARMQAVAARFDRSEDEAASLLADIETMQERQRQYDDMMTRAVTLREQGQLVEPADANALEFAAKAIDQAFDPAEATDLFDGLVADQRRRIDALLAAGQHRDAGAELRRLGAALERAGIVRGTDAAVINAEAEEMLRQADLEDAKRRQQTLEAGSDDAVAPKAIATENDKPSLIFVNPF